mmetsp:Transcript_76357/g.210819  ORF Transcript_76357/g.210819 Transcript_76357/m.210819 type:complete len:523 (-) Transcript_76357:45-1613(-)
MTGLVFMPACGSAAPACRRPTSPAAVAGQPFASQSFPSVRWARGHCNCLPSVTSVTDALLPASILVATAAAQQRRSLRRATRKEPRAVLAAQPRFAPDSSGEVAQPAKKRLPRWAPGGGGSLRENRSAIELLNDMKEEVIDGEGRCYRVIFENGIGIRADSNINAPRTGDDLLKGEVFEVKKEVRRGGRRYFELVDGRGWAFDWVEINGERVELVEIAAQLYTVAFPDGVNGIQWASDTTMRFCRVHGFNNEADAAALAQAGISQGDILVLIDQDPVTGMPLGQVLERVWATSGRQPGNGLYFRVTTQGAYGIGIRAEPDMNGPRTGEDLIRGSVFEVDDIIETEDGPTYLHLADNRGWVFDTSPIDPENPSVENLTDVDPGCTLTMWRGTADELANTIGLRFKQDGVGGKPFIITVLEEGQPIQRITATPGANLRKALMSNGFQVYQELRQVFNCNANQLCGTCVLNVVEGSENLTVMAVNEKRAMAANPPGFRLCCNIDVYGDVVVQLRPKGVRYGGGTS